MKKEWVRPLTTVQCFEADEYVAACYSGYCSVSGSDICKWTDMNGNGIYDEGEKGEQLTDGNRACDQKFDSPGTLTPAIITKSNGTIETGYYFESKEYWLPFYGWVTDTHFTNNYSETNAS